MVGWGSAVAYNLFYFIFLFTFYKIRWWCREVLAMDGDSVYRKNFPVPPPDLITDEEEYKVEKILCHRRSKTNCPFLIQWKGYSGKEDSWIPIR